MDQSHGFLEIVDITSLCNDVACNELNDIRPMINSSDFSLLDSMLATELMDPKMDHCYGMSADSLCADDLFKPDLPNILDCNLVISVLQSLINQEVAFLDGASVLESTHQCILVWEESWKHLDSTNIFQRILKTYSQSLAKSIQHITKVILDADIFEDEDFQVNNAINFSDSFSDEFLLSELEHLIDELKLDDSIDLKNELVMLVELRLVLHKFYMKSHELVAFNLSLPHINHPNNVPDGAKDDNEEVLHDNKLKSKNMITQIESTLESVIEKISNLQQHISSTTAAVESTTEIIDYSRSSILGLQRNLIGLTDAPEISFAYNLTNVNVLQSGPRRRIDMKPFHSSLQHIFDVLIQIQSVFTKVFHEIDVKTFEKQITVDDLLQYTINFAINGKVKPHLYTRTMYYCMLHVFYYDMFEFIVLSMKWRGIPNAFVFHEDEFKSEQLIDNAVIIIWETIKLLCVHRNRVMIRIEVIINVWGNVMADAAVLDKHILRIHDIDDSRQQWFLYWCVMLACQIIDVVMHLKLEYDLLSLNELDCYYWYWEYICSQRVLAMEKLRELSNEINQTYYIHSFDLECTRIQEERLQKLNENTNETAKVNEKNMENSNKPAKNKSKKNSKNSNSSLPTNKVATIVEKPVEIEAKENFEKQNILKPPIIQPTITELYLRAKSFLFRGTFIFLVSYSKINNLVNKENTKYSSWENKFEHRFQVFRYIPVPIMKSYQEFLVTINNGNKPDETGELPKLNPADFVVSAANCFQCVKKFIEEMKKLPIVTKEDQDCFDSCMALVKVAVMNGVNCARLTQFLKSCVQPLPERILQYYNSTFEVTKANETDKSTNNLSPVEKAKTIFTKVKGCAEMSDDIKSSLKGISVFRLANEKKLELIAYSFPSNVVVIIDKSVGSSLISIAIKST